MNKVKEYKEKLIGMLQQSKLLALVYHPDADGMGASSILIKYLLGSGFKKDNILLYPTNTNERMLEPEQETDILNKTPDTVIYLDLSTYKPKEQIERLKKKVKYVITIDHHYFKKELADIFDLCINSSFFDELTRPEAYTASKLLNTLFYDPSNYWLEILCLEGDNIVPSLPGTVFNDAIKILNDFGLSDREDEPVMIQGQRRNELLDCLVASNNVGDFIAKFRNNKNLSQHYDSIIGDVEENVEILKKLNPTLKLETNNSIYVHKIIARHGYAIVGQVLKGHLPYIGYNSTYVLYQQFKQKGEDQIYLYTSNPFVVCNKIASKYIGGGHPSRAGFKVEKKDINIVLDEVISDIKEMITLRS